MKLLCAVLGHAYEPLPPEPGVQYLRPFDGRHWYGPAKCRRCGATRRGFRIPPMPPAMREQFERGDRKKRLAHIRDKLRTARENQHGN